jgi:hypothetical protein
VRARPGASLRITGSRTVSLLRLLDIKRVADREFQEALHPDEPVAAP